MGIAVHYTERYWFCPVRLNAAVNVTMSWAA